ncbi:MAG: hypothetical protein NUV60_01580 [Patescibacteria group bacterium]|nr:hypothetical protein [Patescibacteria group bacterium]
MEIPLLVAKVLGVYFIVSGLFLMFRGKTLANILKDLFDHPAIMYLAGAMLIFLSTVFLLQNNIWDGTWRTLVTILLWLTLAKGVMYILAPEVLHKMVTKKFLESVNLYGIIILVAGVYFFFIG